jgi:CRP/FNR family cyclic AMP-dependent transcriptional regulator
VSVSSFTNDMDGPAHHLRHADIFDKLTPAQLAEVAKICQPKSYSTGEVIFQEGSHSDELYIIAEGEVDILLDPALVSDHLHPIQAPITIATLRQGQCFGEFALVDQGSRSATARAAVDHTQLLMISSQQLNDLCDTHAEIGYRLMRNLAADLALKLRNTDLFVREQLLQKPAV